MNLSAFSKLQSLTWKDIREGHLETLSETIRRNSAHLPKLNLDFLNWIDICDSLGYDAEDEDFDYFGDENSPRQYANSGPYDDVNSSADALKIAH